MGLDNRSVDESIFKVWLVAYGVEKSVKHTGLCPSTKSFENRIPVAEILGQVTLGRPCSHTPKYGLHEPTVIPTGCSRVPGFTG